MTDKIGNLLRVGDYVAFPDWANNYDNVIAIVMDTYLMDRAGHVVIKFVEGGSEIKRASELLKMSEAEVVLWKLENAA